MTHGPELVESFTSIGGVANYLQKWGYNHKFSMQKGQTAELRIVFYDSIMEDTEFTLITHDFRSQDIRDWYGYPLDSPVIVEAIRDCLQYPRLYRKACQNEILSFDTFFQRVLRWMVAYCRMNICLK